MPRSPRPRRTSLRTAIAALGIAVLVLPACTTDAATGPGAVTDESSAIDAIVDSLAGTSWTWAGKLDVDITDDQIAELIAAERGTFDAQSNVLASDLEDDLRRWIAETERQRMHGALADDGSFRIAWERNGQNLADGRLDAAEVFTGDSMTPEAAFHLQLDIPALIKFFTEETEVDAGEVPSVDELRRQAEGFITDTDFLAVVLAILDGEFGGLDGTIPLAQFGATPQDLDEIRAYYDNRLIGQADPDTYRDLLDTALTLGDLTTAGDMTTVSADLHPRDAAFAVYDLFDDAESLAEDALGEGMDTEDLPETIADAVAFTFDAAGRLVEVRTDVVGIATQLALATPNLGEAERAIIEALEGARVDVVFSFGEHGQVTTVMDADATTMKWDDLAEFFFSGIGDVVG